MAQAGGRVSPRSRPVLGAREGERTDAVDAPLRISSLEEVDGSLDVLDAFTAALHGVGIFGAVARLFDEGEEEGSSAAQLSHLAPSVVFWRLVRGRDCRRGPRGRQSGSRDG